MSSEINDRLAAETLSRAADYMAEHGQCQGQMSDENGAACALGAIRAVSSRTGNGRVSGEERATVATLVRHLGLQPDPADTSPLASRPSYLLHRWHDQLSNAGEAVSVMRDCAAILSA